MRASDELLTLAELAIGLAGFSGVVVAFARQGELTQVDRWRFAGLLSLTIGAAATAFVPSILHNFGVSGVALWRASSVVFLVVAVIYLLILPPRLIRISRERGTVPPRAFIVGTFSLSAVNLATQLANALGWPAEPGPALLISGLVIWLVIASLFFALLVLSRPSV